MSKKKSRRKPITPKTRFEVFKRDGFQCQYCGASAPDVLLEVDHIVAVVNGGENDLMNLITSCETCNRGKGKRKLSDDSALQKQRRQLQDENERRVQIEMMARWRAEQKSTLQHETDVAVDQVNDGLQVFGRSLNERGRQSLRKSVKKFGLKNVLMAVDAAEEQDSRDPEHFLSSVHKFASVNRACEKRPNFRDALYIRGTLRKICRYWSQSIGWEALPVLEHLLLDYSKEQLLDLAFYPKRVKSWEEYHERVIKLLEADEPVLEAQ